jgi:hypothetical protein
MRIPVPSCVYPIEANFRLTSVYIEPESADDSASPRTS